MRPRLREAGHEVRAASRSPPTDDDGEWVTVDLADGTGIEAAVADIDVIVHAASAPQGDSEAVDVDGTERLLAAAADAGVANVVYPSIVGIEEIPFSYYEHKLAAERAIEASSVPSTICRATQFHSFVADLLGSVSRLPVWPLPTRMRIQPVDVDEVAAVLANHATPDPGGRLPDVGGPEVTTVGELARSYRAARGLRRPIVRLPIPGSLFGAFRDGKATCPDRAVGETTWETWLDRRYATGRSAADEVGSPVG